MPFYVDTEWTEGLPGQPVRIPRVSNLGRWQDCGDWPKKDGGGMVFWSSKTLTGFRKVTVYPNGVKLVAPGKGAGACVADIIDGVPPVDVDALLARRIRQAEARGDLSLDVDGNLKLRVAEIGDIG